MENVIPIWCLLWKIFCESHELDLKNKEKLYFDLQFSTSFWSTKSKYFEKKVKYFSDSPFNFIYKNIFATDIHIFPYFKKIKNSPNLNKYPHIYHLKLIGNKNSNIS